MWEIKMPGMQTKQLIVVEGKCFGEIMKDNKY